MSCKKQRDNMILYLYGELDSARKTELENHIASCAGCRREFAYIRQVFEALDESRPTSIPEGKWEEYWENIQSHIPGTRSKSFRRWPSAHFPFPRWAYAAVSLLFVFALGILAGRAWLFQPSPNGTGDISTEGTLQYAFNAYLDDLKPYMLEYANYTGGKDNGASITVDKKIIRYLIIQNVLLKSAIAGKNPTAAQLLDDIDLVLHELFHMESDDAYSPAMVKELIKKRDILFKMEVLDTL